VLQQVWCGSANWTNASKMHLEMGLVCDDPQFLYHATDYIRTLIKQSEPTSSQTPGPEQSLVYVEAPDPSPEEIAEWEAYLAESRAEAEEMDDDES
jgi:hypothetical protein